MRAKAFYFFILLLIQFSANGQITFQKIFVVPIGSIFGGNIIQTSDEGLAFTGFDSDCINSAYLIKTNKFGDTLWTNGSLGMPTSLTETYDNGLVMSAITNTFYLVKTNINGDTLWTKEYQFSANNFNGISVSETKDSGLIILAVAWLGAGNRFSCLLKTDSVGSIIWAKSYHSLGDDFPFCVKQTHDGGYIISGHKPASSIFLIKTDNTGDTLWTKLYPDFFGGYSIFITNDFGYVICGGTQDGACIIKTDSLGNFLWSKIYVGSKIKQRKLAIQTADLGFLISGTDYGGGNFPDTAQLIKTDQNGNIVWAKNYCNYVASENWAAIQTADEGYAFIGASGNGVDVGYYLVKTDSNGSSGCGDTLATVHDSSATSLSAYDEVSVSSINVNTLFQAHDITHGCGVLNICSSVGLSEISETSFDIILSPNPASSYFKITDATASGINLFNAMGEKIWSRIILRDENINIENLPPGIYFIQMQSSTGTVVKKLIKQ